MDEQTIKTSPLKSAASRRNMERINSLGLNRARQLVPVYLLLFRRSQENIYVVLVKTEDIIGTIESTKALDAHRYSDLIDVRLVSYENKAKKVK